MRRCKLLITLLTLLALSACGEVEDTRPGQPVAHRQAAFKEMLKAFEPMGVQMRTNRYEPEKFLQQARDLDRLKETPWEYFGPDTNYPPTKAKDSVWSDAARFEADRQAFLKAVNALLPAAESRDMKKIEPAYAAVHDSCRNCHKDFKN